MYGIIINPIISSPNSSFGFSYSIFGQVSNRSSIHGIDINTGRQTWKFPMMNMLDSSAALASNIMLIGSRDGPDLWVTLLLLEKRFLT